MADKQVSKTVVQYEVDSASINRVVKSADKVEAAITDSLEVIGDYSPVTRAAMSSVETGFEGLRRSIQADQAELNDLRLDLLALDDLVVTPEVRVTQSGGAAAGTNGLDVLDRASASASQILGGLGQSELANSAGLFGDAVSSIVAFGPAAGVAVAAGGALTLVISEINAEQERQREAVRATVEELKKEVDTRNELVAAIAAGDPAGINAQIAALEGQARAVEQEVITPLLEQQQSIYDAVRDSAALLLPAGVDATTAQAQSTIDNITQQLLNANSEYLELQTQIQTAQTDSLQPLLDQIEDLREQGIRGAEAIAALNQPIADAQKLRELAQSGTPESFSQELQTLQDDLVLYGQALADADAAIFTERMAGNNVVADAIELERQRYLSIIDSIEAQIDLLETSGRAIIAEKELAEARKAASELYGDLIDESFDALQREGEIRAKATDALEAYAKATAAHEQAIADIRAQADTKRQDDETKAQEDREKAERDHAKRIADIQRKTNATLANAIMARDALAYILAQAAAKEQIDSENDAYKERQKDIDDALKKQLASQDKALKEAIAKEEARWRDEKQTRDRAIAQIQNDLTNAQAATASMQRQAAQQAFMIELDKEANLRGSYERQAATQAFYLSYMEGRAAAAWSAMASVIGGGHGVGSPGGAGAQPTPFADGGYVTRTGLALVHAGEKIYPPIQPAGRAAFGSSTTINQNAGGVTLNIRGNSPAQIRREVDMRLTDYFRAAGMV